MNKNIIKISKFLSLILRHKPEEIGLQLDENGWAVISEIVEKSNGRITDNLLRQAVTTNEKQRFAISDDGQRIRANQGHSVKVELNLKEVTPHDVLFHGTATRFLKAILTNGLQKMDRNHVHLSGTLETASKVGQRHGKLAILIIDAAGMHRDGYPFYLSKNGVWLVDAVPTMYLTLRQD
jgi:putative RNA 2'-phosphotransferase